jgi:hypothetical protein
MPPELLRGLNHGTQYLGPNIGERQALDQQADQFTLQRQDAKDRQHSEDMRANQQQDMAQRQMALQELMARLHGQQVETTASFQKAQLAADERKTAFAEKQGIEESQFRKDESRDRKLFAKEQLQATKDEGAETRLFQSEEAKKTRDASAEQRDLDRAEESRIRAMEGLTRLRDQAMLSNMQHGQELEKLRLQIDAKSAQDLGDGVRNLDGALRTKGVPDDQIREALRGFVRSHISGARVAKALGEKAASTSAFNPSTFLNRLADIQRQSQEAAQRAPDGVKAIKDAANALVTGHESLVKELSGGPAAATNAAAAVGNIGQMGLRMLFGQKTTETGGGEDVEAVLNEALGVAQKTSPLDKLKKDKAKNQATTDEDETARLYEALSGKLPEPLVEAAANLDAPWKQRKALYILSELRGASWDLRTLPGDMQKTLRELIGGDVFDQYSTSARPGVTVLKRM